jgi:hypothetical protein
MIKGIGELMDIVVSKPVPNSLGKLYEMFCNLYPKLAKEVTGWKSAGFKGSYRAIVLELAHGASVTFDIQRQDDGVWYMDPFLRLRPNSDIECKVIANNYKGIYKTFCSLYPELVDKVVKYEGCVWEKYERGICINTTIGDIYFSVTQSGDGWEKPFVDYLFALLNNQ